MAADRTLSLHPIGWVVKGRSWPQRDDIPEPPTSTIEIELTWAEALDGVEGFSHIWVIWWPHRFDTPPDSPRVHPEGRTEIPSVGLFATRSPRRPNPIAITAVRLVERVGNRLVVEGLDASQDSPILDIKPYLRRGDLVSEATSPEWLNQLWRLHDEERACENLSQTEEGQEGP